jgi:hypothetical protein
MTRDNLTRDEIIKQIAEEQWDIMVDDFTFNMPDILIYGCKGLNELTDEELASKWDYYFANNDDDDDDDDDELIEVLDRYIANNDDSE